MNMIWFCITSLLISPVISDLSINTSKIRVFPAENRSIAGVLQVTYVNDLNQPKYAFNASEARELCESLRLKIASKAQVQEALSKGLETCRFGWIDEHLAVIPRIKASLYCGKNQTGLVSWRASVVKKFDVFCFNESDTATQMKDTTDGPLTSSNHTRRTLLPSQATVFTSNHQATQSPLPHPSPSSLLPLSSSSSTILPSSSHGIDTEAEPAQYVGTAQGSIGGPVKIVLITLTCGLLLIAVAIFAYIKRKRSSLSLDMKQQQENIETEEWTCVKNIKEPKKDDQEAIKITESDKTI
ncbi:hypothetical protein LDENG_00071200 [Lucifuga dentata]|nr:hypothetical protein LDENG_00071200 [Lucifuga dentata]